jgi:hypothetical protein
MELRAKTSQVLVNNLTGVGERYTSEVEIISVGIAEEGWGG